MSSWLVVVGAVGGIAVVAALIGMFISFAREGQWGMAVITLGALALILFLTLVGMEHSDDFWKGRS